MHITSHHIIIFPPNYNIQNIISLYSTSHTQRD